MTHTTNQYDAPVPAEHLKFYTELGRRFKNARIQRGISLEQLANIANITPERLEKYEKAELVFPIYEILPMVEFMGYPHELDRIVVD